MCVKKAPGGLGGYKLPTGHQHPVNSYKIAPVKEMATTVKEKKKYSAVRQMFRKNNRRLEKPQILHLPMGV